MSTRNKRLDNSESKNRELTARLWAASCQSGKEYSTKTKSIDIIAAAAVYGEKHKHTRELRAEQEENLNGINHNHTWRRKRKQEREHKLRGSRTAPHLFNEEELLAVDVHLKDDTDSAHLKTPFLPTPQVLNFKATWR